VIGLAGAVPGGGLLALGWLGPFSGNCPGPGSPVAAGTVRSEVGGGAPGGLKVPAEQRAALARPEALSWDPPMDCASKTVNTGAGSRLFLGPHRRKALLLISAGLAGADWQGDHSRKNVAAWCTSRFEPDGQPTCPGPKKTPAAHRPEARSARRDACIPATISPPDQTGREWCRSSPATRWIPSE